MKGLSSELTIDRTTPQPAVVSDLLVEDGVIVGEWSTDGDAAVDSTDEEGSGLNRFEVEYRVSGGSWSQPEAVDAREHWIFTKDIGVPNGTEVEMRVRSFDNVGLATDGEVASAESVPTPGDPVETASAGVQSDVMTGDDPTKLKVTGSWASDDGAPEQHVRLLVGVKSLVPGAPVPQDTIQKDCFEVTSCDVSSELPAEAGQYRSVLTVTRLDDGSPQVIAESTSTPTTFGEAVEDLDPSIETEFADFHDEYNIDDSEIDEVDSGASAAAWTAPSRRGCRYNWKQPDFFFKPTTTNPKYLQQYRCRYGVKIGGRKGFGNRFDDKHAKKYGVADSFFEGAYFSNDPKKNFIVKPNKSGKPIVKALAINPTFGGRRIWPLYDTFGSRKAWIELVVNGADPKNWSWAIFDDVNGSPAPVPKVKHPTSRARIKVQGMNCYVGNRIDPSLPAKPAFVGFDIAGFRTRLFISRQALPLAMSKGVRDAKRKIACGSGGFIKSTVSGFKDPRIPTFDRSVSGSWDLLFRQKDGRAFVAHVAGALPATNTMYLSLNTAQVRGGEMARGALSLPTDPNELRLDVGGYMAYCDRNAQRLEIPNLGRVNGNYRAIPGLQWAYVRVRSTPTYTPKPRLKRPNIYGWVPVSSLTNTEGIIQPTNPSCAPGT